MLIITKRLQKQFTLDVIADNKSLSESKVGSYYLDKAVISYTYGGENHTRTKIITRSAFIVVENEDESIDKIENEFRNPFSEPVEQNVFDSKLFIDNIESLPAKKSTPIYIIKIDFRIEEKQDLSKEKNAIQ